MTPADLDRAKENTRFMCGDFAVLSTAELMLLDRIAYRSLMTDLNSDPSQSYQKWCVKQVSDRRPELQQVIQAHCEHAPPDDTSTDIRPQHYGGPDNPHEAIKVIEAWSLNFNLGNAVKYICRYRCKGTPLEDLKKARWYLDREIEAMQQRIGDPEAGGES